MTQVAEQRKPIRDGRSRNVEERQAKAAAAPRRIEKAICACGNSYEYAIGFQSGRPPRRCGECRRLARITAAPGYSKKAREAAFAITNAAKDRPCADCGQKYPPCVMDFDHVRGEKIMAVSRLVVTGAKQALLDEIAKCDVVCANCHRLRHMVE